MDDFKFNVGDMVKVINCGIENDMKEDTIGEVESEILEIAEKLADCICD